ncbi:MAG: hypothetical protein AAGD06_33030, partial [Acidobacteriota bacterium]
VVNGAHGVARWDDSRRERAALQQALRATATATEVEALDLTPIYPQPENILDDIETLRRHRLSLFRDYP